MALLVLGCATGKEAPREHSAGTPADSHPPAAVTTPTVVFLGTSLTAGLGLDPEEAYPALIQRKIDSAGFHFRVVNAGVSGESSAGSLRRIDWILREPPAVLVVETGANDGLRGQDPDSLRANIQALLDRVRQVSPRTRLLLVGMAALPNLGASYAGQFRSFPDLARKNRVALIPFLLDGVAGVDSLNQADGMHPNAVGERIVADNVWGVLGRSSKTWIEESTPNESPGSAGAVLALLAACGGDDGPGVSPRSYRMGFSAIPPRADPAIQTRTLTLATQHSDAGLIQLSIPWATLLSGITAPQEMRIVRLPLVNYYRGSGRAVVVALDVTDGLNRAQEDPALIAAGRSITDTAIQRLYRDYVSAVDSILHPDYLSLAAETNLIRLAAPSNVYAAVVTMVNAAAAEQRVVDPLMKLLVSVQGEVAWGRLQGGTVFTGIAQDRTDFPFLDALGLSSYPYLGGFTIPEDVPLDYYQRLVATQPIPLLVLEGGWPSVPAGSANSSPAMQARYIRRQQQLLDQAGAAAVFQITFTDLDLMAAPPPPGSGLPLFADLGLVDTSLTPKPALATWDSVLARPYLP